MRGIRPLTLRSIHRHFLLHKPYGVLSQFVTNQALRRKKRLLGGLYDFPSGTMAIGRLDEASEGLLLLTTDGKMSEAWRGKHLEKEYYALVDGIPSEAQLAQLRTGVDIGHAQTGGQRTAERYITRPCHVECLTAAPDFPPRPKRIRDDRHGPSRWISLTLTEGKYRQVRKMTAAVGLPTLRLVRVRIGPFAIERLRPGYVEEIDLGREIAHCVR